MTIIPSTSRRRPKAFAVDRMAISSRLVVPVAVVAPAVAVAAVVVPNVVDMVSRPRNKLRSSKDRWKRLELQVLSLPLPIPTLTFGLPIQERPAI